MSNPSYLLILKRLLDVVKGRMFYVEDLVVRNQKDSLNDDLIIAARADSALIELSDELEWLEVLVKQLQGVLGMKVGV